MASVTPMVMAASMVGMAMVTSTARGLLMLMLLLLPRLILTTVSMASAPTTATLATPMSRMLLSTARGLLKPPLPPSLLLIPTTATAMLATTATLATPMPMAVMVTTTARGLLMLLPTLTTATTVDMDTDTVTDTVDTTAATVMATTTESKKDYKCQRMKTTTN